MNQIMNLILDACYPFHDFSKSWYIPIQHLFHVFIILSQRRNTKLRRNQLNCRRNSISVFSSFPWIELFLERYYIIQQTDISECFFLYIGSCHHEYVIVMPCIPSWLACCFPEDGSPHDVVQWPSPRRSFLEAPYPH